MRRQSAFATDTEHIRSLSSSDGFLVVRKKSVYSGTHCNTDNCNDEFSDEDISSSPIPRRKQANIPFLPQFQPKVIRFLSDTRRKAHLGQTINHTQEKNYLLRYAVRRNDWEHVQRILRSDDVNINYANDRGITALHEAAIDCSCACVKTLVDNGADLNQTDNEGFTALDYAVCGGDFECAALLIRHGASEHRIRDGLKKDF